MKRVFVILFPIFLIQNIFSQCDCEKINRADGTVIQCKPLPIGGDNNLQLGLSLASNGKDNFITLTIRYISGQPLKISGDLSLRLLDNNLLTFNLVNTQSSFIGNSEVENGIFFINQTQFNKIKNAKLLTISINLSDNRVHTIEAIFNQDVLMNQSKCLKL
jgi:hypothetical protein